MRIHHWLVALFGIGLTLTAHANLSTFDNTYTAKLYGFSITANSRLSTLPNGNYEYSFNADSSIGKVTEVTEISWNEKEKLVVPQHYTYKRKGIGNNRDDELAFDWANLKLNNIKKDTKIDIAKKLQDSLSYQVQLNQDLIAGKKNFDYSVTNGRKVKQYKFEIVGEETLPTALGDVKAVKVKRTRDNEDLVTYAWFAKEFQYLLVSMQQEENGSAYTIYISKASLNGKAIEHF
jgi:hypothetical protein